MRLPLSRSPSGDCAHGGESCLHQLLPPHVGMGQSARGRCRGGILDSFLFLRTALVALTSTSPTSPAVRTAVADHRRSLTSPSMSMVTCALMSSLVTTEHETKPMATLSVRVPFPYYFFLCTGPPSTTAIHPSPAYSTRPRALHDSTIPL
jgi:hypothetical protein